MEGPVARDMSGLQTLVLNADYRPLSMFPLSICSWQDAVKAIVMGRVNIVSEYEVQAHSPSTTINIPSVIALKRYISSGLRKPALTRHNILLRDLYLCQYCEQRFSPRSLTLDHVVPRCHGGETSWHNLVAACHPCNTRKGDKHPGKEFRMPLQLPHRPSARQLQRNARELATYNFHESWDDYLE